MQSTLFLNAITCVDHSVINTSGQVIGGSYHPNFEVSGKVEEVENVVIDFSSVKKEIKSAIDHKEIGYDHKLWIIDGYSNCSWSITNDTILIDTPACTLTMPLNAVRIFRTKYDGCFQECVEKEFDTFLTREIGDLHPGLNICVKTIITIDVHCNSKDYFLFRYSHGLKNSSSWGCQNHSHGHLSFIELQAKDRVNNGKIFSLINKFDRAVFIFRDNIVAEDDATLSINYTTERGNFRATYQKAANKLIVLDTETTIEHIAEWFVDVNREALADNGVTRVFVSEGLSKGAVVDL